MARKRNTEVSGEEQDVRAALSGLAGEICDGCGYAVDASACERECARCCHPERECICARGVECPFCGDECSDDDYCWHVILHRSDIGTEYRWADWFPSVERVRPNRKVTIRLEGETGRMMFGNTLPLLDAYDLRAGTFCRDQLRRRLIGLLEVSVETESGGSGFEPAGGDFWFVEDNDEAREEIEALLDRLELGLRRAGAIGYAQAEAEA